MAECRERPRGRMIEADAADGLGQVAPGSVHLCVTSPPYWNLRDYGLGRREMGRESAPAEYIESLVSVFSLVRASLAEWGSLCVNIGDTMRGGPCGIPWRFAFAMESDGWRLVYSVVWSKPNPMPEPVRSRPSRANEMIFCFTRQGQRGYYEKSSVPPEMRRDVWTISHDAHRATHHTAPFPLRIPKTLIACHTPEPGVCGACGAPYLPVINRVKQANSRPGRSRERHGAHGDYQMGGTVKTPASSTIVGWRQGCECERAAPTPAVILDPFMGSGTTAIAARDLGRHWVGVDLCPKAAATTLERTRQGVLDLAWRAGSGRG